MEGLSQPRAKTWLRICSEETHCVRIYFFHHVGCLCRRRSTSCAYPMSSRLFSMRWSMRVWSRQDACYRDTHWYFHCEGIFGTKRSGLLVPEACTRRKDHHTNMRAPSQAIMTVPARNTQRCFDPDLKWPPLLAALVWARATVREKEVSSLCFMTR